MPFLKIYTNAELKNKDSKDFVEHASHLVAETLGKPIGYVVVSFISQPAMAFGGSVDNKGVLAEMESIGFSDKAKLISLLTEFFMSELKDVEGQNVNISTRSLLASDVAIGGHFLG